MKAVKTTKMILLLRYLFFSSLVFSSEIYAQGLQKIEIGHSCSYFGEPLPAKVVAFGSDSEAEKVIQSIVNASGLAQNFEIKAGGVPNAAAVVVNGIRYIVYNQHFMRKTQSITNNRWSPISVMAHEIGHHLNGHTLDDIGSRPEKELEADYYSGFILQRLGASLDDARALMEKIGNPKGSDSHPPRHDRLAAIDNGWIRACEADPGCEHGKPRKSEKQSEKQSTKTASKPSSERDESKPAPPSEGIIVIE